jgi:hypothetical protein
MLDVTGRGIVLRDLAVRASADVGLVVEDEGGRAGRALVEREDERQDAVRRTVCSDAGAIDVVLKRRIGSISAR